MNLIYSKITSNYCNIRDYIIINNINLNLIDDKNRTPLLLASQLNLPNIVLALLECGANIDMPNNYGITALHEAAGNNCYDVVKILVEKGANINAVSEDNITPLMCAVAWGYKNIVIYLLKCGANISIKDNYGMTAYDIANEKGEYEIVDLLQREAKQV